MSIISSRLTQQLNSAHSQVFTSCYWTSIRNIISNQAVLQKHKKLNTKSSIELSSWYEDQETISRNLNILHYTGKIKCWTPWTESAENHSHQNPLEECKSPRASATRVKTIQENPVVLGFNKTNYHCFNSHRDRYASLSSSCTHKHSPIPAKHNCCFCQKAFRKAIPNQAVLRKYVVRTIWRYWGFSCQICLYNMKAFKSNGMTGMVEHTTLTSILRGFSKSNSTVSIRKYWKILFLK